MKLMHSKNKFNFLLIFLLLITSNLLAQSNNSPGIYFQAVARDNFSNPAKDRSIYVESSVIQTTATGTVVLKERFQTQTDITGVFNIVIGQGLRIGGTSNNISSIDWSHGPFYLNLKIAIAPVAPIDNWDYTSSLIDLGTSPFGSVPYALFAGAVLGFETKLNATDTAKMLSAYAKDAIVKDISSTLQSKLSTEQVMSMLEPYAKKAISIDSGLFNASIATKLSIADSSTRYVTPTQLKLKTFDSTTIYNQLALKELANNKSTSIITDAISDSKYPSVKAVKNYVDGQISVSTIADADATTKGKIQIAGDLTGTAASPLIANNAVTTAKILDANITTSKIADANITDAKIVSVSGAKISGNISGNAASATKIATPVTINGVAFDGTSNITIASAAANAITFDNSGSGGNSPTSFDGSSAKTISYNTIGAEPSIASGTSSQYWRGDKTWQTLSSTSVAEGTNLYYTDARAKSALSLTTTGNSGAATYSNATGVFNIPNYSLSGLGYSLNGLSDASQSFTVGNNGTDFNISSASGIHTFNLPNASATARGLITTGSQTFAGEKTFNSNIVINGISVGRGNGNNDESTAIGAGAMGSSNVNGKRNTAIGAGAMAQYNGTSFDNNTSIGYNNLPNMTSGSGNTSVGAESMLNLLTGVENTSIGNQSLINVTGNSNVGVGKRAGQTISVGSQNTIIGTDADVTVNNLYNATAIGYGAAVANSNTIQLGNTSVTSVVTSGTISATGFNGPLVGNVTGNASTATRLANTKNINGIPFDGTGDITIAASAGTLTGTSLASNVTSSSLTELGTITTGTWSATSIDIANGGTGATTASGALSNLGAESVSNRSNDIDMGGLSSSNSKYPSQLAVKTYVSNQFASGGVADNSITNAKLYGAITAAKLVGVDIATVGTITTGTWNGNTITVPYGGTGATSLTGYVKGNGTNAMTAATSIPVADITGAEAISNKATVTDLGGNSANDTKYPSQLAVKTYVDTKVAAATIADADATTKGKLQLTGDLGGTATSPTVVTVGGSTASDINAATILTNAATASNTTNAIVKRDANGDFVARNITASLLGNAINVTGIVAGANGGTGVDNTGKTITLGGNFTTSGNYNTVFTLGANTNLTLPSTGTLVTLTGSGDLTNKTINGLTPTALNSGFTIAGGTNSSTTLTVGADASVSGTNTGDQTISLTGDVIGSGTGTFSTTLANSGVTANTYGSATSVPVFSVDAKGRITGVTNTTITGVGSTLSDGKILLGNGSSQAAEAQLSGDVTMDNTGATSIGAGKVTNGMLAGSIDLTSKVTGALPVANGGTGASTFSTGFVKANGTNAFTTVSNIPVASITGAVSKVNGVSPNSNGEVSLTFGRTYTGLYASYDIATGQISTMTSPANSDIYIVAGDPNTADNGRTFVFDGARWQEISNNQSATDARYVQLNGSTLTGNLIFTGTTNKVTVEAVPTGSYDLTNKTYVDAQVAAATIADADGTTKGKLKLAGDLGGTADLPTVAKVGGSTASSINAATVLANAATNANTASAIVKRDASGNFSAGTITANITGNLTGTVTGNATNVTGTVAVANGGSGATSLTGYLKGNGTSAFTAATSIPVADVTGAEAAANKATATDLGASSANDTKYPTQLAVKTYVDSKVAAATIADADATTKGKLQLAGDFGGTAASPSVVSVGTSTASNIHAAELLANAATNANTASTIVKRDASGNFSAGTITASLSGNATNVTGVVLGANGGTGVANTGKTITLGGNLTTSGAYNTTLTTTGNTTLTLPSAGTLSTLTGSEAFTNKTINGLTPTALTTGFTIAGGTSTSTTLTVGNNASISGTNTGDQTISLTGDITGTGTGSFATTLANSGVTAGSYGSATTIPAFSVDAKGRITGVTNTTVSGVSPVGSALTSGNILVGNSSNLAAAVGVTGDITISNTGVTAIGASKVTNAMLAGSIDLTNKVTGVLPMANGGTGLSSVGTSGQVLSSNGTGIVWSNPTATVTAGTLTGTVLASNVVSSSLTSLGTITTGVWSGTAIASNNIATALTGKTYNGLTPTAQTTGFTIAGGATTSKTLTVSNDATVSGNNTGDQTITLTGDVTGTGTGTFTTTLANSGVTAGSYGNATTVPAITVDAKGRITSVTATTITASSPIGTPLTSGNLLVGSASNLAASVPMSGDVTISSTGAATISSTVAGNKTFTGSNTFSGATTTVSGNLTGGNTATSTLAGFAANINVQTGTTYTLASTDNGKIITMNNASAITLTVPSGLIVGFNCMIVQLGAGQVTLTGSGATITNRSGFNKTGGQNAITTLISVATNSFISSGDMSN
jgi:hypothetical protein